MIVRLKDVDDLAIKKKGVYVITTEFPELIERNDELIYFDDSIHPKFQAKTFDELVNESKSDIIVFVSNSPFVIQKVLTVNVIVIHNDGARFLHTLLDRDIDTITTRILNTQCFHAPTRVLHKKYRKLADEGYIETREAKMLKRRILEWESENSSFFQDINFDIELMS